FPLYARGFSGDATRCFENLFPHSRYHTYRRNHTSNNRLISRKFRSVDDGIVDATGGSAEWHWNFQYHLHASHGECVVLRNFIDGRGTPVFFFRLRFRNQGAHVSVPHVAARCSRRGANCRLSNSRRSTAQTRNLWLLSI